MFTVLRKVWTVVLLVLYPFVLEIKECSLGLRYGHKQKGKSPGIKT